MSPPAIKHPGDAATSGGPPFRKARPEGKIENDVTKACKALAVARSGDWLGDGGPITL